MRRVRAVAVIPAFNEEKRVGAVVRGAKRHVGAVLVVDDGSTDRTSAAARAAGAKVLAWPANRGAGYATRAGAAHAIGRMGAQRLVFLDADGQHPAERIPELLAKLDEGFDIVFTARKFNGGMPLAKRFGNWWLTAWTRLLTGMEVADSQCGFKAFTAEAYRKMSLKSDRYGICSEIVLEAARNRLRYSEIGIRTIYADRAKGTTMLDGIGIFIGMLRMRLGRAG